MVTYPVYNDFQKKEFQVIKESGSKILLSHLHNVVVPRTPLRLMLQIGGQNQFVF